MVTRASWGCVGRFGSHRGDAMSSLSLGGHTGPPLRAGFPGHNTFASSRRLSSWRLQERAPVLVSLLLLLLACSQIAPNTAGAHASLLGSTPADGAHLESSPDDVVLEFSEPVGPVDGGTTLHSQNAEPQVLAPQTSNNQVIIPIDHLDDGSYILQWRVISADAHPVSGTIRFAIGNASVTNQAIFDKLPSFVDWARSISVGVKYFGVLTAFGLLSVGWMIARTDLKYVMRLSSLFAILGLLGIILELPLAAMIQRGTAPESLSGLWADISNLQSSVLTAGSLGILFVILASITLAKTRSDQSDWRLSSGFLVGALLTIILSGHTQSRDPVWLMMILDSVHIIVAALWLGGIVLLAQGLRHRWEGEAFRTPESSARVVVGFSTLAGYTAGIVALSGVVMAILILDSFAALYKTDYGRTLLIKVGMVGVVALLAAVNRYALIPGIRQTMPQLRRLVTWELVFLVLVVGATGVLVQQDPNIEAREVEQVTPVTIYQGEESLDEDHTLRMTVKARSGSDIQVVATIIDSDRNIIVTDESLHLNWYLPDQELGPLSQEIQIDLGTGAYTDVILLPAAGEWELEAQIRIDRFTDSRTTINIVVPE